MEGSPRKITKKNYYINLILYLFQTTMFILTSIHFTFIEIIIHFTLWNYMICSFYLFIIFISDTCLYFFSITKLEKLNYFMRNKYSHVSFSICCGITIIYWFLIVPLAIFGNDSNNDYNNNKNENNNNGQRSIAESIIINLYTHGGINIILLIELIINKREKIKYNFITIISIIIIDFAYSIVLIMSKEVFNLEAYDFIKNITIGGYIFLEIILIIFAFITYSINYWLVNLINKKEQNTELTNEEEVVKNEFNNNDNDEIIVS